MKKPIDKRLVSQFVAEMSEPNDEPMQLQLDNLLIRAFLIWAQAEGFQLVKVQND